MSRNLGHSWSFISKGSASTNSTNNGSKISGGDVNVVAGMSCGVNGVLVASVLDRGVASLVPLRFILNKIDLF